MTLQQLKQILNEKIGQKKQILFNIKEYEKKQEFLKKEIEISKEAQIIINAVSKTTQEEFSYRITEPVSLALAAVYENDPYKMVAQFEIAGRGVSECKLGFERNGNVITPKEASGGGPIDIASYALRLGSLSLTKPKGRNILILDEPFKWVQRDKMELAGQMLKETSKKLGIQIIMISHIPELMTFADKIFDVSIHKEKIDKNIWRTSQINEISISDAILKLIQIQKEQIKKLNKKYEEINLIKCPIYD